MAFRRSRKRSRSVFSFPRHAGRRRRVSRRRRRMPTAIAVGIEKKFFDSSLTSSNLIESADATGGEHNPSGTTTLNSVTQGDGESNRDGRKMIMKYISVKGTITVPALSNQTVSANQHMAKVYLVWDKQTNGTLFNSEDVMDNQSASALNSTSMFRNMQFAQRFQILAQQEIHLEYAPQVAGSAADGETGEQIKSFKFNVPLPDIPVNFSGVAGTVANITDNSINLMGFAQVGAIGEVLLHYNSRLRFVG